MESSSWQDGNPKLSPYVEGLVAALCDNELSMPFAHASGSLENPLLEKQSAPEKNLHPGRKPTKVEVGTPRSLVCKPSMLLSPPEWRE